MTTTNAKKNYSNFHNEKSTQVYFFLTPKDPRSKSKRKK